MTIETVHEGWVQLRGEKGVLVAEAWRVHTNDAKRSSRRGWSWAIAPYTRHEIHWAESEEAALAAATQALEEVAA